MNEDIPDYLKDTIEQLDNKIEKTRSLLDDPELRATAEEEIKKLEAEKQLIVGSTVNSEPNTTVNPYDPLDHRNIILEIRGAAGGEEAKLWGQDLLRMYTRYALSQGWSVQQLDDMSIKISGKGVYGKLKYESGVHRVQRVPVTEASGRIHTSTATVAVLPELEDIDVHVDPSELKWEFFRSGGKGGQNVNKLSTAVRLLHTPSGLTVTAQSERSQEQNRALAETKLRALLWEKEQDRILGELSAERRAQIGTGMRNEKIRTYNFLQDRVTDHRLDKSFHNLEKIMDGEIQIIITGLDNNFRTRP